jgi:putative oxidoreductase
MHDVAFAVGRILLAAIFVISGFMKLTGIAGFTGYLTRLGVPAPQIMAWLVALFEVGAGLMVMVGFQTRWAALALAVFCAITLFLGHKFWAVEAAQYANQLNHALKNIAMIGGFILLAFAGPGGMSVDARRRGARWA